MSILRTALISAIPLAISMIQGCNSDSAEKFNGEWIQVMEGKGLPDKISIACDAKTCEWRFNSGFSAYMSGRYKDNPEAKHLIFKDGALDLGLGGTATIQDDKLYYGGNVFIKNKT